MTPEEAMKQVPHLLSPGHLAIADTNGKWKPAPHLKVVNTALVKAWRTPNSRTAINLPFQHGKRISNDTLVWTEDGWKTHGDLQVGDYVFAPNGAPIPVLATGNEGITDYEIRFSDGSVIQCHGNHEWYLYSRTRHKWYIFETRELLEEKLRDGTRYNISVPRTSPLIMADQEHLPIHPYALGAWLGDGQSDKFTISHSGDDWEVVNGISTCGHLTTNRYIQKDTGVHYAHFKSLDRSLHILNLTQNKHIPNIYLCGSIEQRLDLLAGLIDTDGSYSSASGQYRFTNTNKRLIDQVAFLANSLGFKVGKIQEYEPALSSSGIQGRKVVYVLVFSPTRVIPCKIPRKQTKKLSERCRLAIVDVRRCDPKPGKCIQVEGGLYLVGERLITTHNSWLCSVYFPAWVLLRWPNTRIALASYEEGFACNFGSKVKDVVQRFGPALGIQLRSDSQAKGEWVIDDYVEGTDLVTPQTNDNTAQENTPPRFADSCVIPQVSSGREGGGGMVCKGRGGALVGRPADLLILDDLIKNQLEAQSPTILEGIWDWYCTVAYSRLGPTAPVIGIGTRWGPRDIFGRWEAEARVGGDKFTVLNFAAIAEQGDVLGRQPGEALWPERVPLERLQRIEQTRPRWFRACWQGKPQEDEGLHFQPRQWPKYSDVGDAWRIHTGIQWHSYRKVDCTILIAVDWAQSGKKQSDRTAIVVAALTPDGRLLILDILNKHLRYEENAPALESLCTLYHAYAGIQLEQIVSSDDDMLSDAMLVECRRYRNIPEIKRLGIKSRSKIIRAQSAIIRSQNGLFYMPEPSPSWYEQVCDHLSIFTGEDGAEDDIADCFGILGRLADDFAPGDGGDDYEPALGAPGQADMYY